MQILQSLDFYPRSPCGERRDVRICCLCRIEFLSTLSLRRATHTGSSWAAWFRFLSTLSLRRATVSIHLCTSVKYISIHALLAESDRRPCFSRSFLSNFYPLSPCGERRTHSSLPPFAILFLSTLSLRRATLPPDNAACRPPFLSTLSLRRATAEKSSGAAVFPISIHALLAESDK